MKDIFEDLLRAAQNSNGACLATVVATEGTAPRKEGSRMLVIDGRPVNGAVTIGGCVDAQVIEASQGVTRSGRPELLRVQLGEEDAFEIGLTCAGILRIFIEPVGMNSEILSEAKRLLDKGEAFAFLAVTRSTVPAAKLAAKGIVSSSGEMSGSLGPPGLNQTVLGLAKEFLSRGVSRAVQFDAAFRPTENDQQACVEVFIDTIGYSPDLYVFGATQVAVPVARLASRVGFRVHVIDSRPIFATRERFPDASEILVGFPGEIARQRQFTQSSFALLLSHAAKHDLPVLEALLQSDVQYIGVLGSSRRAAALTLKLREMGFTDGQTARLHIPVGLDIGAETGDQTAVAVVAELLMMRNGKTGKSMKVVRGGLV
jgi:xanthine dehydrogenase accessory factor